MESNCTEESLALLFVIQRDKDQMNVWILRNEKENCHKFRRTFLLLDLAKKRMQCLKRQCDLISGGV